jgi:hypothetical protein
MPAVQDGDPARDGLRGNLARGRPLCLNRSVAAASERESGRPFRPAAAAGRLRGPGQRLWLALDLLIVAWLIWLFDAINNLAPVRQQLAERNGARVLELEQLLHVDAEHALDRWLARHDELSQLVVFWYENVHIIVTLAVYALLWWRRADLLAVMRWVLVLVNAVALAIFWSFPVAPPRMLDGGYVDLVARVHGLPVWQLGATALDSNQLCSLPSLHIAWATWCSIAVWNMASRSWLRALAVLYPLLTTYAVMATGNHYLADAVTGAGLTGAAFLLLSLGPIRGRLGWLPDARIETGLA